MTWRPLVATACAVALATNTACTSLQRPRPGDVTPGRALAVRRAHNLTLQHRASTGGPVLECTVPEVRATFVRQTPDTLVLRDVQPSRTGRLGDCTIVGEAWVLASESPQLGTRVRRISPLRTVAFVLVLVPVVFYGALIIAMEMDGNST